MKNRDKTIEDFGEQWQRYTSNNGYYGSQTLLQDIFGPLLEVSQLKGKVVGDVGSGTGRIVNMLLSAGVKKVVALEPSDAFYVLKENTAFYSDKIEYINLPGEKLSVDSELDYVFSIGVLHHIPQPESTMQAMFDSLKPGGRTLIWLYGKEGNELYLAIFKPVRSITKHLPHFLLSAICHFLNVILFGYINLCKVIRLPMTSYMLNVVGKFDWKTRYLAIYDQLNPAEARYYTREQAQLLLETAGFQDIELFHRHSYSWTVIGRKPD